jgi:hypothetical protein
MSIAPVVLDDLTWKDLTAAALRRIPAASMGRWTLQAPVDPGITLMELHAWLLEQRLYWMNPAATADAFAILRARAPSHCILQVQWVGRGNSVPVAIQKA